MRFNFLGPFGEVSVSESESLPNNSFIVGAATFFDLPLAALVFGFVVNFFFGLNDVEGSLGCDSTSDSNGFTNVDLKCKETVGKKL